MTRDEIEQKLWADQYHWGIIESEDRSIAGEAADAAVAEFRKRYPPQPSTPPAVWYDEPPCPKDGSVSPVWLFDYPLPILVAYFDGWMYEVPGVSNRWHHLAGRRVSPIVTPQEPTT